jgi:hypothetical protein
MMQATPPIGNMRQHWPHAQSLLIDAHEGAIDNVDFAPFDENDGQALLDRDGFEGRQHQETSWRTCLGGNSLIMWREPAADRSQMPWHAHAADQTVGECRRIQ